MPDCVTARSGPGSAVGAVCSRGAEQHTTAAAGTTTSDGYAEAAGPAVAAVADHHGVAAVAPVTTVAFNAWGAVAAFPAVAAAPAVTDQPGVAAGAAVTDQPGVAAGAAVTGITGVGAKSARNRVASAILRLLALQVHREGGQRPTCLPVFEQRLRQLAVGHRAFVLAPSHHRRARGAGLSEAHSTGDGRSQHL